MEYDEWLRKKEEFEKKISTPEYHEFCEINGLKFHFWDKMEGEKFNPKIAFEEMKLHWKAMGLFNISKNKYTLFGNKIVEYLFFGGELELVNETHISLFLESVEKLESEFNEYKEKVSLTSQVTYIVLFIWIFVIFFTFNQDYFNLPDIVFYIIFIVPLLIINILSKYILKMKKKKMNENKENQIQSSLDYIITELNKIKNYK